MMTTGMVILVATVCFLIGAVAGFFLARKNFMSYMEKNPPINEEMLVSMMSQMGQKPSTKKINQMMSNMQKAQKQAIKGKK
ncbi:YneF family protein [Gemella sp. zg-570]|nr:MULTISPECIES: YneF family protein [unclassified Gemella]MBU0278124.1 YneF family protein [Gemella sp. zg-1178]QWQ38351.1 YneF family protein [Gemella sp. zg-570]